jgi:catechol 2,3-dioxygenase-like lactoylglutathione lyase family enzyme
MITNIEHVALSVANLERSIAFYRDIIGFKVARILECEPEMRLGDVNGMPGCTARIAHLYLGNNMLELFEYQNPQGKKIPADRNQADHGFIHLGLTSTDAQADYERLKERRVKFLSKPIEFRPGVWIFYFYGPDGEVCELRES